MRGIIKYTYKQITSGVATKEEMLEMGFKAIGRRLVLKPNDRTKERGQLELALKKMIADSPINRREEVEKTAEIIFDAWKYRSPVLNLAGRYLPYVPKEIGLLTSLKSLNLNRTRLSISSVIPDEIENLKNLRELGLAGNGIKDLPKSFGKLERLWRLQLKGNQLEKIPDCIFDLKQLVVLVLDKNKIKEVPDSLRFLQSLATLRLSENEITSLPEAAVLSLPSTGRITVSDNPIADWVARFSKEHPKKKRSGPVVWGRGEDFDRQRAGQLEDVVKPFLFNQTSISEWKAIRESTSDKLGMESFGAILLRIPETNMWQNPFGRQVIKEAIGNLLDDMEKDPALRKEIFEKSSQALGRCADRVAIGADFLITAHINYNAARGKYSPKELLTVAEGMYVRHIIERIASLKALSLRTQESSETFLRYYTSLSKQYQLPGLLESGIRFTLGGKQFKFSNPLEDNMHFGYASGVKFDDLQVAKTAIDALKNGNKQLATEILASLEKAAQVAENRMTWTKIVTHLEDGKTKEALRLIEPIKEQAQGESKKYWEDISAALNDGKTDDAIVLLGSIDQSERWERKSVPWPSANEWLVGYDPWKDFIDREHKNDLSKAHDEFLKKPVVDFLEDHLKDNAPEVREKLFERIKKANPDEDRTIEDLMGYTLDGLENTSTRNEPKEFMEAALAADMKREREWKEALNGRYRQPGSSELAAATYNHETGIQVKKILDVPEMQTRFGNLCPDAKDREQFISGVIALLAKNKIDLTTLVASEATEQHDIKQSSSVLGSAVRNTRDIVIDKDKLVDVLVDLQQQQEKKRAQELAQRQKSIEDIKRREQERKKQDEVAREKLGETLQQMGYSEAHYVDRLLSESGNAPAEFIKHQDQLTVEEQQRGGVTIDDSKVTDALKKMGLTPNKGTQEVLATSQTVSSREGSPNKYRTPRSTSHRRNRKAKFLPAVDFNAFYNGSGGKQLREKFISAGHASSSSLSLALISPASNTPSLTSAATLSSPSVSDFSLPDILPPTPSKLGKEQPLKGELSRTPRGKTRMSNRLAQKKAATRLHEEQPSRRIVTKFRGFDKTTRDYIKESMPGLDLSKLMKQIKQSQPTATIIQIKELPHDQGIINKAINTYSFAFSPDNSRTGEGLVVATRKFATNDDIVTVFRMSQEVKQQLVETLKQDTHRDHEQRDAHITPISEKQSPQPPAEAGDKKSSLSPSPIARADKPAADMDLERRTYWNELSSINIIAGAVHNKLSDDFNKAFRDLWRSLEPVAPQNRRLRDALKKEYLDNNGIYKEGKTFPWEFVQAKKQKIIDGHKKITNSVTLSQPSQTPPARTSSQRANTAEPPLLSKELLDVFAPLNVSPSPQLKLLRPKQVPSVTPMQLNSYGLTVDQGKQMLDAVGDFKIRYADYGDHLRPPMFVAPDEKLKSVAFLLHGSQPPTFVVMHGDQWKEANRSFESVVSAVKNKQPVHGFTYAKPTTITSDLTRKNSQSGDNGQTTVTKGTTKLK